mgnify:CR=1 FL=1
MRKAFLKIDWNPLPVPHLVLDLLDLDGRDGGELELADDGEGLGRIG